MIEEHVQLYSRLTRPQAFALWSHLHTRFPIPPPDIATAEGSLLGEICRHLSHAEVVVSLADRFEPSWCDILDRLLEKPVYICAMGEMGDPPLDDRGIPIPVPLGHRRGEALGTGGLQERVANWFKRPPRHDPRVITYVESPCPKQPRTQSWDRYQLYRVGMTVSEFLLLGGRTSDVSNDSRRGHIRLELP